MKLKLLTAAAAMTLVTACGKEEKKAEAAATLSASWKSNNCATCHGTNGKTPAVASYPTLVGSKSNTEAKFIALVRAGVAGTGMTAYSAASYPEADLKADYKVLGGQ